MTIKLQIISKSPFKRGVRKAQFHRHKQYVEFKSWLSNNLYLGPRKSCSCDVEQWRRNPIKLHLIRADGLAIETESTIYLDGTSDSCIHDLLSVTPFDRQSSNLNSVISFVRNKETDEVRAITVVFQSADKLTYVRANRSSFVISPLGSVKKDTDEATNSTTPIHRASKIAPEFLLAGTTPRRVRNPIGSRFWLIHIHNMIEELRQNYQDYCNKMTENVSVHSQVQVSKYMDLNHLCGYKLSDGTTGYSFKDRTCLVKSSNSEQLYYINCFGQVSYFKDVVEASRALVGKNYHLWLFNNFARENVCSDEEMTLTHDLPFLVKWHLGSDYVVMYFSNGTLEILLHSGDVKGRKIIFSPFMRPISILENGENGLVSSIDMKLASHVSKRLFHRWSLLQSKLPHTLSKLLAENTDTITAENCTR